MLILSQWLGFLIGHLFSDTISSLKDMSLYLVVDDQNEYIL